MSKKLEDLIDDYEGFDGVDLDIEEDSFDDLDSDIDLLDDEDEFDWEAPLALSDTYENDDEGYGYNG